MAHFAKLDDDGIVTDVIVVNNETIENQPFPESEAIGVAFLTGWSGGYDKWKQTSYSGSFRKKYAGVGYTYDETLDAFVAPRPFVSWTYNAGSGDWEAPTAYPQDGNVYMWDEPALSWVEFIAN